MRVVARPASSPAKAVEGMVFEQGTRGLAGCSPSAGTKAPTTWFCSTPGKKVREALSNAKVPRRVQQQGQIVRGMVQRAKQKGKGRANDQDLKIQYAKVCKEVK